jgi:hypothetical protein
VACQIESIVTMWIESVQVRQSNIRKLIYRVTTGQCIQKRVTKHYQKEEIDYETTHKHRHTTIPAVRKIFHSNEDMLPVTEGQVNKDINRHFRHHKELYIS